MCLEDASYTTCCLVSQVHWPSTLKASAYGLFQYAFRAALSHPQLFLDISAEYYPERLGLFMIVDAPSLFGMLWKAIRSFVDPKTHKKVSTA